MRDQWEVNVVLKTVLCVHSEVIFFFSDNAVMLLLCFSYCLETFFFFLETIAGKGEAEQGAGGEAELKMAKKQQGRTEGVRFPTLLPHTHWEPGPGPL